MLISLRTSVWTFPFVSFVPSFSIIAYRRLSGYLLLESLALVLQIQFNSCSSQFNSCSSSFKPAEFLLACGIIMLSPNKCRYQVYKSQATVWSLSTTICYTILFSWVSMKSTSIKRRALARDCKTNEKRPACGCKSWAIILACDRRPKVGCNISMFGHQQ